MVSEQPPARLAVLASHGGSTLQGIMDACADGELAANVVLVISNNSGSGALARARAAGIEGQHISGAVYPGADSEDAAIANALTAAGPDWVVLAGYMKRLQPQTLSQWQQRMINTHPALLPKHGGRGCYGDRVHAAVLEAREPLTGVTVHRVSESYDRGVILAQAAVPVEIERDSVESLRSRLQTVERRLLIWTLQHCIAGNCA